MGQGETNTYFISLCLIGYQIGTRVGEYCIRHLRVYRLPLRPLQGVWWGVCNTPLHYRQKNRISRVGGGICLGKREMNTYFIPLCLIGYQMGTRVGAQKHTPPAHLSSTISPLAGRLVGRKQYVPTLSKKDKVSSGRCFLLSRTMAGKYIFHFFMSNRLSDRYPGRAQKHTPLVRLSSTLSPLAGRLVGRMQYAPTLPTEKSDLKGWRGVMFGVREDEYIFHFTMSNRLSDRYPGRAQKHTSLARLSSTPTPFAGRLVGRMQYAPTLLTEKSDLKGWRGITLRTIIDSLIRRTKKGRIFWREDRRRKV